MQAKTFQGYQIIANNQAFSVCEVRSTDQATFHGWVKILFNGKNVLLLIVGSPAKGFENSECLAGTGSKISLFKNKTRPTEVDSTQFTFCKMNCSCK